MVGEPNPEQIIAPRHRDVVKFIFRDPSFERAGSKYSHESPQKIHPVRTAHGWDIPVIESDGALADRFWLKHGELEWFADLKGLGYRSSGYDGPSPGCRLSPDGGRAWDRSAWRGRTGRIRRMKIRR
jgi:hypothetical protein